MPNQGHWADAQIVTADRLNSSLMQQDVVASRPAAAQAGRMFYATDENAFYRDTGSAWDRIDVNDFQRFTASGTWTRPVGARTVIVDIFGAGGGGAGGQGAAASSTRVGGGGGGGGSRAIIVLDALNLGSTETITIGAGGTGGAGGVSGNGVNGNVGGDSSFGSHVTAYGGGDGGGTINVGEPGTGAGTGGQGDSAGASSPRKGGPPRIQGATEGDRLGGGGAGLNADSDTSKSA